MSFEPPLWGGGRMLRRVLLPRGPRLQGRRGAVPAGSCLSQARRCMGEHPYAKGAELGASLMKKHFFAGKLKHRACLSIVFPKLAAWTTHRDANVSKDLSERSTEPNPARCWRKSSFASKFGEMQPMKSWRGSGEPHLHVSVAASLLTQHHLHGRRSLPSHPPRVWILGRGGGVLYLLFSSR